MEFKSISPEEISGNLFSALDKEWMLVSAGDSKKYNMMTASWGGFGVMWGKSVAVCVVRPQRYTYEFLENSEYFTLSFYGEAREIHHICGTKSGRDIDKTAEAGLTPVFYRDSVYFEEARMVLCCKKLYVSDIKEEGFVDKDLLSFYKDDFHRMYVGQIIEAFIKK